MSKKPNLVFVVPDEFRPYSMGFLGKENVITPAIDTFAKEATTFTRCASNFPVCSPYRAILFSGKYPHNNGVMGNCNSTIPQNHLRDDITCLTDILNQNDYSQGYIGKLHLHTPKPGDEVYGEGKRGNGVVWDAYTPPGKARHGIDYWHSYGCCDNHNDPHYWIKDAPVDQPYKPKKWSAHHETEVAVDYIKNTEGQRDKEKPFALFVAYNPPHMPFNQVPEKYRELYADKSVEELLNWENLEGEGKKIAEKEIHNYYAMISGIDECFGKINQTLKEEGLEEDTIVIFTSDHGELMGSHGKLRKNEWENESFLVPFLLKYPRKIQTNQQDDVVFSTIDLAPSILGLMDLEASIPNDYQGEDISKRWQDKNVKTSQNALYLFNNQKNSLYGRRGIMTDRYTYVIEWDENGTTTQINDNIVNPHQFKDVEVKDPRVKKQLNQLLKDKLNGVNDPFSAALN